MNVIAYSPFQDGGSAEAVGGSDRAIASDAAHKPTRLLRRSGAIGFSSGSATTLELERAATILDIYPIYTVMPTAVVPSWKSHGLPVGWLAHRHLRHRHRPPAASKANPDRVWRCLRRVARLRGHGRRAKPAPPPGAHRPAGSA